MESPWPLRPPASSLQPARAGSGAEHPSDSRAEPAGRGHPAGPVHERSEASLAALAGSTRSKWAMPWLPGARGSCGPGSLGASGGLRWGGPGLLLQARLTGGQ